MIKKLLSYLIPITIYQKKSNTSKTLEVTWANGQLVLDSKNTNYSYGSLQRILRKGLKSIGDDTIGKMEHILVLGVAGGSVIKTLADEIHYKGKITGVEIDSEIIKIANDYFRLNTISNLDIVIEDALEFVRKTKDQYDLIIIDIFQDNNMPEFLFEKVFVDKIKSLLRNKGFILFNTMVLNKSNTERNLKYINSFSPKEFTIRTLPKLEHYNELIIIQKT